MDELFDDLAPFYAPEFSDAAALHPTGGGAAVPGLCQYYAPGEYQFGGDVITEVPSVRFPNDQWPGIVEGDQIDVRGAMRTVVSLQQLSDGRETLALLRG